MEGKKLRDRRGEGGGGEEGEGVQTRRGETMRQGQREAMEGEIALG